MAARNLHAYNLALRLAGGALRPKAVAASVKWAGSFAIRIYVRRGLDRVMDGQVSVKSFFAAKRFTFACGTMNFHYLPEGNAKCPNTYRAKS